MSSGYSGKPLAQKLGIRRDDVVVLLDAPDGYDHLLGLLPEGVTVLRELIGEVDFIQVFATRRKNLEDQIPSLTGMLKPDGMLWVSWPKRSSKLRTDLSDGVVRDVGLNNGLVDVKVCAIDRTWSALKFVRRSKDRDGGDLHLKKRTA